MQEALPYRGKDRAVRITIKDGATPKLKALVGGLQKRKPLHATMGKRGEVLLRAHFSKRDMEPNGRGWPKQNFWGQMRKATAYQSDADEKGASVAVSDRRMNQKVYGGTVTPKESKYLAIPAIPEAYGKRPSSFDFLRVHHFKSGAVALVETDRTLLKIGKKRKNGTRKIKELRRSKRGRVWYWLARSVTQRKDPDALPSKETVTAALSAEVDAYVSRLLAYKGA